MPDGTPVDVFTLTNGAGTSVRVLELGGIVQSVRAPDRAGALANVVLGFEDLAGYLGDRNYIGALIGRFAGRIAGARYHEAGRTYVLAANDGDAILHGGPRGFDKAVWRGRICDEGKRVRLHHVSPDGDQGFPGELAVEATFELTEANAIVLTFSATTSGPTVINLTHHGYWNLTGQGAVRDHRLSVHADEVLEVDAVMAPTGRLTPVEGGPLDLRRPRRIGEIVDALGGVDYTFILRGGAWLADPASGRTLEVWTTEPGLTVYTANQFETGGPHPRFGGVALESEHFPDSPNHPAFPSTALWPGQTFFSRTVFTLGVEGP
jgi:aldose 1-epimerase